jgi:hypothetical protein
MTRDNSGLDENLEQRNNEEQEELNSTVIDLDEGDEQPEKKKMSFLEMLLRFILEGYYEVQERKEYIRIAGSEILEGEEKEDEEGVEKETSLVGKVLGFFRNLPATLLREATETKNALDSNGGFDIEAYKQGITDKFSAKIDKAYGRAPKNEAVKEEKEGDFIVDLIKGFEESNYTKEEKESIENAAAKIFEANKGNPEVAMEQFSGFMNERFGEKEGNKVKEGSSGKESNEAKETSSDKEISGGWAAKITAQRAAKENEVISSR